jgi:predicted DNA-binding transcriptional regulator AlpA
VKSGNLAPTPRPAPDFAEATWELMRVIRLFGIEERGPDESGRVARGSSTTRAWLAQHASAMADALVDEMARRLLPPDDEQLAPPEQAGLKTQLLSASQVCAFLQISRSTLQRWEKDRWIPAAIRYGVVPRWSRAELVFWFRNREWQG